MPEAQMAAKLGWASLSSFEIAIVEENQKLVGSMKSGDLTADEIVAGKVDENHCGSTLADREVRLRQRNGPSRTVIDDFAGYWFAHAASSSGGIPVACEDRVAQSNSVKRLLGDPRF